jgi:ribonuclease HI
LVVPSSGYKYIIAKKIRIIKGDKNMDHNNDISENKKTLIIIDACCHIPEANVKSRKSKGKSAAGIIIIDEKGEKHPFGKYLGEMTTPEAEFNSLKYALDKASEILKRNSVVEVRSDSELVIKWMTGEYRIKKEHIKDIYDDCKKLERRFFKVEYKHHPRDSKLAKEADKIAQQYYDSFIKGEDVK